MATGSSVGGTLGGVGGTLAGGPIGGLIGSGIGSLLGGAYDWWESGKQQDKIDELEKDNVRPAFDIPQGATDALASAKAQSLQTRLPGQSAIEGRLDQTTANQVALLERAGMGGTDLINGASRAYGMQQDKENQLGVAAAQNYNQNQNILRDQENNMANWQNQKWNWDTGSPYLTKQNAINALKGAQLHNQDQGFKDISGGITMGLTGLADKFNWFGSNNPPYIGNNKGNGGNDSSGNWYNPTSDDTGAPMYGEPDYSNFTEKMMNSGMGFFNGN